MISEQQKRAIQTIAQRLGDLEIAWCITGGLGFALHGICLPVNDIDLQTDREGAYRIEGAFSDHIVRRVTFSQSTRIRSHFGELYVEGVRVEIMGALQKRQLDGSWEPPVDVLKHRQVVNLDSLSLPVMSLAYEEQAYRKLGRTEKADRVRAWLTKQKFQDRLSD